MDALLRRGALPWPNPETAADMEQALAVDLGWATQQPSQEALSPVLSSGALKTAAAARLAPLSIESGAPLHPPPSPPTPDRPGIARVRDWIEAATKPMTETQVASGLQISRQQAKEWLQQLADEGVIRKLSKPARYQAAPLQTSLFPPRE